MPPDVAIGRRLRNVHEGFTIENLGGAAPIQASGRLRDGRPFYFRARHGEWEIEVGPPGGAVDGAGVGERRWLVAKGADRSGGYMPEEDVRSLLRQHLGQQGTD
jgi:hypothetical protein